MNCLDNNIAGTQGLGRYQELAAVENEFLRRWVLEQGGFARVEAGQESMPGVRKEVSSP